MAQPEHARGLASPLPSEDILNHKQLFVILIILGYLLENWGWPVAGALRSQNFLEPVAAIDRFHIAMALPENWQNHRRWTLAGGAGR